MTHITDEELVLHYYGEGGDTVSLTRHLESCAQCAGAYEALSRTLTSVTSPVPPEPGAALSTDIWRHVSERVARGEREPRWTHAAREGSLAMLLVWLVPLVYPFAPRALFESARLARTGAPWGTPLMMLSLAWAFAGPFVALFVINRIRGERIDTWRHRLVVFGAVAATVSPALYNLTQRSGMLPVWYLAIGAIALASLIPLTESTASTMRLRRFHRTSATLIVFFAAFHLINHAFAIVSVPTHSAVLAVLRLFYRQPVLETLLFAAIVFQIGSGAVLVWQTHLRRPTASNAVQALSGLYLAVFFMAHVSAALMARGQTDTNFVWAAGRNGLLASRGLTLLLPYYLLGVVALFAHVGMFARRRVSARLPEVSLRRLSYAGMAFSGAVVLTIGLALCGIGLVP
jgi:hypothetical protein